MKHTFYLVVIFIALFFTNKLQAQDTTGKKGHNTTVSIGPEGIQITQNDYVPINDSDKYFVENKSVNQNDFKNFHVMLDLGFNTIQDNSNYNSTAVKNFLNVPANRQNASLFNLYQVKSINVDIYPWLITFHALKTKRQRINITTGIGLQLYNFRYENPITFTRNPNSVILDSISFKKDKLAFDFLNVPLMITFKTKLHKDEWLIYGIGITAGYSIATWTKQETDNPNSKTKVHDDFGFSNYNSCVTAEVGITDIRFYATYQLTNMFNNNTLNQHPISFGIRF